MASRQLNVSITGDARSLNRALSSASTSAGETEGRFSKFSKHMAAAIGSAFAIEEVVKFGKESVQAAETFQQSQARLVTQLKASGISYRDNSKEINEVIERTANLSGIVDGDLQDAFTNLVRSTGNVKRSLNLVGTAADIARAKHIDVAKAGQLLGKVAAGNVGALGRYGIAIQKGTTATEALGIIQRKFSGQAEAYGKTTAGAMDRFHVAVERLQVSLGQKLLPIIAKVATKLADFIDQFNAGTGAGGRFKQRMEDVGHALAPVVRVIGQVAAALAGMVRWVARASANIVGFINDVRTGSHESGSFGATLHDLAGTIGRVASKIANVASAIFNGITAPFRAAASAVNSVVSAVQSLIDKIPKIHIPHISLPHIGSANVALHPNPNPGPSITQQLNFAASDVTLAQTDLTIQGQTLLGDAHRAAQQHRQKLIASRLNQIRRRLKAVQKALGKRGLSRKDRTGFIAEELALMQEQASLAAELNSLASDIAGPAPDTPATTDTTSADSAGDTSTVDTTTTDTSTTTTDTSAADLKAAIDALKDEVAKQNAHADAVKAIGMASAFKALADVISGRIAGYDGYAGRAQTAGAGSTYRL